MTSILHITQRQQWESAKVIGSYRGDEFPHIYGALNLDAVVQAIDFEPTAQGFSLPTELIEAIE
jgi:uncharacterized protein (DUF952 family)